MTKSDSKFATVLHLAAFPIYVCSIYYTFYKLFLPIADEEYAYGGKWKFLTVWNVCLCGAYSGLCLLINVLPLRFLRNIRDYVFCSVSLPTCIFVTCSFWGLYAIDRELIFPKKITELYPEWLNHSSHTLVMVTAILEALLRRHKVPSRAGGFLGMLAWFLPYQIWILYLGNVKGIWVYPVLKVLSAVQLTVYFIGNSIILYLLHGGCNALLRYKNRSDEGEEGTELKKVA